MYFVGSNGIKYWYAGYASFVKNADYLGRRVLTSYREIM